MDRPETKPLKKKSSLTAAFALAGQLGYTIAIPIVVLALGGRLLDKRFGSSPLFLLLGVALSVAITSFWITIKAKKMLNEIDRR